MLRLCLVAALSTSLVGCAEMNQTAERTSAPPADNQAAEDQDELRQSSDEIEVTEALVALEPIGGSQVTGNLTLVEQDDTVTITGNIAGLTPGLHGFHVHESGDLSDKQAGKSAGGHFNPTDQQHGKPDDQQRHVGDLGNIEADDDGIANVEIVDEVISLSGEHSIIGKALVVHGGEDQFTQPTGDAGNRVAFGVIERK